MDKAKRRPSGNRLVYRLVVVGLTVAGLVANDWFYRMTNLLIWIGGPFSHQASMAVTLVTGLVLWFLPVRRVVSQVTVVVLATFVWAFASAIVMSRADGIQQKFWIDDTEGVAKAYGLGALPPDCSITGTVRGNIHTPLKCNGTVTDVATWYRGRLGPDWIEGKDAGGLIFTRTQPGLPVQKILIYHDKNFVQGTSVVVSPTQTNNW